MKICVTLTATAFMNSSLILTPCLFLIMSAKPWPFGMYHEASSCCRSYPASSSSLPQQQSISTPMRRARVSTPPYKQTRTLVTASAVNLPRTSIAPAPSLSIMAAQVSTRFILAFHYFIKIEKHRTDEICLPPHSDDVLGPEHAFLQQ